MLIEDSSQADVFYKVIEEMEKEMKENPATKEAYNRIGGVRSSQIRALLALLINRGIIKG